MRWANRKTRVAVVLAIAVMLAVVAYRTSQRSPVPPCEPGRIEEKDASGKVVKISRTECRH